MDIIKNWSVCKNICLDGLACSGKTTLVNKFDNKFKINELINTKNINIDSQAAFNYLQFSLYAYDNLSGYVFDRSPISNIAWLIIANIWGKQKHKLNNYNIEDNIDLLITELQLTPMFEYILEKDSI